MEKISIIGSYEDLFAGNKTSMALRINIECLKKYLQELKLEEIYDSMFKIIKNHGSITFYHRFRITNNKILNEVGRRYFNNYGCLYKATKSFEADINNLKKQLNKSLNFNYLRDDVLDCSRGLGWYGVHFINIKILSNGKVLELEKLDRNKIKCNVINKDEYMFEDDKNDESDVTNKDGYMFVDDEINN